MMVRRDFELIANVLAGSSLSEDQKFHITMSFATRLVSAGPGFDPAKFIFEATGRRLGVDA